MKLPQSELGVYWGTDALYFVETISSVPRKTFSIPLPHSPSGSLKVSRILPESMQLVSTIQQTLRFNEITPNEVNIALPTHEIIFRTFVIPWMKSGEVKGVVNFEAIKYIPFALEELYYAFYPMVFNEGSNKKIRVIFVAIKKETLENYMSLLEQVGLLINVVEPAPLAVMRALLFKKIIKETDSTAVLVKSHNSGKIIVVDQGIPQFVREFQLGVTMTNHKEPANPQAIMTRLMSETRISLDYFARQDSHLKINQVHVITSSDAQEVTRLLKENLSLDVHTVTTQQLVGDSAGDHWEYLPAFGLGLTEAVKSQANFNLCPTKPKGGTRLSPSLGAEGINYKNVGLVGGICAGVLAMIFILTGQMNSGLATQLAGYNAKLGQYKDSTEQKLKQKLEEEKSRLEALKNTRLNSEAASLLEAIPKLLPPGAWLKNLDLNYSDTKFRLLPNTVVDKRKQKPKAQQEKAPALTLEIAGYVYSENAKEQFQQVNKFLQNLKENELFKKTFNDIDLDTVKVDRLQENIVTYYKIRCQ